MQQGWQKPSLIIVTLVCASFACSPGALKRSQAVLQGDKTDKAGVDDPNQNTSTEATLSTEPLTSTDEQISPPANISGSYLMCAEAKAASAESPQAIVNCGLRSMASNSKIDISGYSEKIWTYQVEAASPITASIAELTTSLEWHVAITLKASNLGEVQTAQKSIKFFLTVTDAAGNKFQEKSAISLNCSGLAGGTWLAVPGDSVYGTRDFYPLPYPHVENLPGIQWKLKNLREMSPTKHKEMVQKLEQALLLSPKSVER